MPAPVVVVGAAQIGFTTRDLNGRVRTLTATPLPISGSSMSGYPAPVVPSGSWPTAVPTPTPAPVPTRTPPVCLDSAHRDVICPNVHPDDLVYSDDGGGQEGYTVNGGSGAGNGDFYAAHQALTGVVLYTPEPGDSQQFQAVYTPTTHGPNGNCLEISTMYTTGLSTPIGTTDSRVGVFNFCDNGGTWEGAIEMDQNFFNSYVRVFTNGNGTQEYIAESVLGTDNAWHFLLYNVSTATWEDRYDTAAGVSTSFNGGQGWSMFETHYSVGACSPIPPTSMSGLRYYVNSNWVYASMSTTFTYPNPYSGTSCFDNSDDSGAPFYEMWFPPADWGWNSSTQNLNYFN
jgi:hypothetical protein